MAWVTEATVSTADGHFNFDWDDAWDGVEARYSRVEYHGPVLAPLGPWIDVEATGSVPQAWYFNGEFFFDGASHAFFLAPDTTQVTLTAGWDSNNRVPDDTVIVTFAAPVYPLSPGVLTAHTDPHLAARLRLEVRWNGGVP